MSTNPRALGRPMGVALTAAVALLVGLVPFTPLSSVRANSNPQPLSYAEAWTDTSRIDTDDDWSAVPGAVGYLGQDITTATGVNPQTLLAESAVPNDVAVIANQTDTTITNGGVAEFELADPVVALHGSDTADAPYLLFTIGTTGFVDIEVAYNLRDIDGSLDNAIQPVALQYRVGTTGNFVNVPAAFVADATSGPSLATLVTPVGVSLSSTVNNRPVVQLRVMTSNAVGSDEWVGVDDFSITGSDRAPSVQSTVPLSGASGVDVGLNVSITFSEPVDVNGAWFSLSCLTSGAHAASVTGGPVTYTIDPAVDFAPNETCQVIVTASRVTDQDTDDPPDTMNSSASFGFTTGVRADIAPSVAGTVPADGAADIGLAADLTVTFSEPVDALAAAFSIECASSGSHDITLTGGPVTFSLDPTLDFASSEACTVTVHGAAVTDQDTSDPPDEMAADHVFGFTTTLAYGFDGFLAPIDNLPIVNAVKAGQTVPVKFTLNGDLGLEILAGMPTSMAVTCASGLPTDELEATASPGGSGLSFDPATGIYTYPWKTDKAWANQCRVLTLELGDGTHWSAAFKFRK